MNNEIREKIIADIGKERFYHSIRVKETALKLAEVYPVDLKKAETAALFHDCAKIRDEEILRKRADEFNLVLNEYMLENSELIHAPLGAEMAKLTYGITDIDVLNAIKYHTTGKEDMNMLEKIIYMADYIEPMRNFPGIEDIRDMAFKDIDRALFMAFNKTIVFLIKDNKLIQPDTVIARNKLKYI